MANFFLVCGISGGGKTVLSTKTSKGNPNLTFYNEIKQKEILL